MKGAWWWTSAPRRSRRLRTRRRTPRLSTRSSPSACAAARTWVLPYLTSRFFMVLFSSVRGACCGFWGLLLRYHVVRASRGFCWRWSRTSGRYFLCSCRQLLVLNFWLVPLIRQEFWNLLLWICRWFWWPSSAHIVVRGNDMPNFLFIGICPGQWLVELLIANWW